MTRFIILLIASVFCCLDATRAQSAGNVFLTTEQPRLTISTPLAETVVWSVKDFWGKEVATGTTSVSDGKAPMEPKINTPGYFTATWETRSGSTLLARGETPFAIVPPLDSAAGKDTPFGLMTHFAQNWERDVIPVIARSGINNIRDEIYWAGIEKTKGTFAFPANFDAYMAEAKANHLEPLIVLSFGNPNYDNTPKAPTYGNAPFTDEGRAGYARYAEEVLKHYGDQIKAVEIWNEYNGTFGKGPAAKDKPRYYFEMLKVAHDAIKKLRPDVTVVGISAVAAPFPYFEELFKRGALQYMDALSLHPYRTQSPPEGLERQLAKLQELVKKYNNGQPKPIWITELGWYLKKSDDRSDFVITEADQAKYLVRAVTLCLSAGVEKFYWYHARDDKSFPTSGVLRGPGDPLGRYAPKPAYVAYSTLARELDSATFEKREPTIGEDVYSLLFRHGEDEVRVMWSLKPVNIQAQAAKPLTLTDLVGGTQTLEPKDGAVTISLTDTPIYVTGALRGLPPVEKQPGEIVANSEEDFSSEQGASGWSYGTFVAPEPGGPYDPAAWTPMPKYNVTIWGYEWVGEDKFLKISPSNAHPATTKDKKQIWAVRRWKSSVEGKLQIKAHFTRSGRGDGATARIFVDGKEVWSQQIGGGKTSAAECDITVPVKTGTLVDISVDPGPALNVENDATSTSVVLVHIP